LAGLFDFLLPAPSRRFRRCFDDARPWCAIIIPFCFRAAVLDETRTAPPIDQPEKINSRCDDFGQRQDGAHQNKTRPPQLRADDIISQQPGSVISNRCKKVSIRMWATRIAISFAATPIDSHGRFRKRRISMKAGDADLVSGQARHNVHVRKGGKMRDPGTRSYPTSARRGRPGIFLGRRHGLWYFGPAW
jgi:hypothetical protein